MKRGMKNVFLENRAASIFLAEFLIPKGFQRVAGDKRSAIPGS